MEESKSLFAFHSKQDVAENFSLDELLGFVKENNLQEWLVSNFYESEARKVTAAIAKKSDDNELKLLLCKIFDLPIENLSADELEELSSTVEKNQQRELFINRLPGDDRKAEIAGTQGELVKALKDAAQLIYLCGGEFRIPLNLCGVTYIGCENAVIDLDEEFDVDLDANDIILENLQVYLHHAINLRAAKSKNIRIIDGSKKALETRPTLREIFHILRGRRAFESPEDFKNRAEEIRGAAIGETLLEDKNYNFAAAQFPFQPRWDFEYLAVLKNFVRDKIFSVGILPKDAELLYINERKLQIFADLTYRGGKLTILKFYFATKTLGIITIEVTLRGEKITSASSGVGLGYGLEIITEYQN